MKVFADLELCHDDYDEGETTKKNRINIEEQIQVLDEANLGTSKGF